MKKIFVLALCVLLCFPFASCSEAEVLSRTWYEYFDTAVTLYAVCEKEDFDTYSDGIERILSEYHEKFDIYGDGEIASVNANAGIAPVSVSEETLDLLEFSLEMYDLTNGKCHIAMGSVLEIWHTFRENALLGDVILPASDELEAAAEHTDLNSLIIDRDAGTVYISDAEMSLDLGAVAKGWCADRCRDYLISVGAESTAVSLGGNIAVTGGKTLDCGWRIGVEDPSGRSENIAYTELFSGALATSGSYQRYFDLDGVRYHHIIDPDTLIPKNELLSVTVFSESAAMADALSTALFNMPPDEGIAFVSALDGVEALSVSRSGEVLKSSGFPTE